MFKIEYYNKKFKDDKIQGSDDWLEGRRFCFGGSEVATVLGMNKYETFEKLIYKKKYKINEKDDKTEWGHLFEQVAKKIIYDDFGYIFNYGSVTHPFFPIAYSPDGILLTEDEQDIMLLEIKSPIYRNVDSIPDYYIPQIQTGLNIFNCRSCLFAQFRFRRCELNTSPISTYYDFAYHKEWKRKCDTVPITFGYLWWDVPCELIDLGKVKQITKEIEGNKKYKIMIGEEAKFKTGKVLMWKLFNVDYTEIEPNKTFLTDIEDLMWEKYMDLLKYLKEKEKEEK